MLLKAGTYRFNENTTLDGLAFDQSISADLIAEGFATFTADRVYSRDNNLYANVISMTPENDGYTFPLEFPLSTDGVVSHTFDFAITEDTEVDDTFGTWYITNTNYNEVNAPVEDTIYTEKSSWYKSVADAIRNKKGTSAPILRDDFASEISSITGGEETPEYDGTVIIEKAESVLGLRRWKGNVTPIYTYEPDTTNGDIYEAYGFEINPLHYEGYEIKGFSCVYVNSNGGYSVITHNEGVFTLPQSFELVAELFPEFEVISTNNSTVDEWLLANTEGVSV